MKDINQLATELANGLTLEQLRERQQASAERRPHYERSQEAQQAEVEYWRMVFSTEPRKNELFVTRSTKQEMDFSDARKKFWVVLQERAARIAQIENDPAFQWVFGEDDKRIIQNLIRYFINDPSCEYPLTKGLFLFGQNGTGKTEMMQALSRFTIENDLSKTFVFSSMSDEYTRAKSDKDYDPVTINAQFDRCFDEFGRYMGPVKRFGDDLDINEAIIEARYNRFRKYGQLTHFIANMTPNEAKETFTPMIFDRLRSMCTSVEFKGQSKRK